jgi:hypothetical protein
MSDCHALPHKCVTIHELKGIDRPLDVDRFLMLATSRECFFDNKLMMKDGFKQVDGFDRRFVVERFVIRMFVLADILKCRIILNRQQAKTYLQKALHMQPSHPIANYQLAHIYYYNEK